MTAVILLQDPTAAVHEALEKSELRGKAVELVDGRRGYLLRAGDGAVEAVLFTDIQTIAWHDLTPETVVRLAGKDSIDVAAYLLKRDRTAEAHAMLAKILSEDSSRASDVKGVLAEGGAVPAHAWLFGEDQGRYLLSVAEAEAAAILAEAKEVAVPACRIGHTGGLELTLNSGDTISLDELRAAHEGWLPDYMARA